MELYAKANRIAEPPFIFNWTKPTPVGWNSWGVIQEHIDYDKVVKVANFFADSIPAFRTGGKAYIDLDSYWDKLISHGDYSKLKEFAGYCKSKGLEPGVYWAPFTDLGHGGGPDRIAEGGNYKLAICGQKLLQVIMTWTARVHWTQLIPAPGNASLL